ncbi:MAG: hypothetical protein AAF487_00710 [Bacteroidota bacterium]
MEWIIKILLGIHITAGFTSIVIFWIPMLSRKGGKLHIKSGKLYVWAMWVVVCSAALLSIKNIIIGNYNSAIFLGFLTIITSGPLWYAIAILNQKKGRTPEYKQKLFYFNLSVVLCAIAMISYGFVIESGIKILMFIFGGLGLTSIPDVLRHLRGKEKKLTWIQEHLIGMISTGIAAYTAFLVFGGQQFFGQFFRGNSVIILWTAPGVLGTIANFYFSRKYAAKKK